MKIACSNKKSGARVRGEPWCSEETLGGVDIVVGLGCMVRQMRWQEDKSTNYLHFLFPKFRSIILWARFPDNRLRYEEFTIVQNDVRDVYIVVPFPHEMENF